MATIPKGRQQQSVIKMASTSQFFGLGGGILEPDCSYCENIKGIIMIKYAAINKTIFICTNVIDGFKHFRRMFVLHPTHPYLK